MMIIKMFFELNFMTGLLLWKVIKTGLNILNRSVPKRETSPCEKPQLLEHRKDVLIGGWDLDESSEDIAPALPNNLHQVPLNYDKSPPEESLNKSEEFYRLMKKRRNVQQFSKQNVPKELIYNIIKTAGTASSGTQTESWTYVVISDSDIKQKIREIIEEEGEINYKKLMGNAWTTDLRPLKLNWVRKYLTDAPYLILMFKQVYSTRPDGTKKLYYYNKKSTSLAAGILLAAIQYAGLVSITSTPLNCGLALRALLGRPRWEKLTLILPVGYATENCFVPDLEKKPLEEIMVEF